MTPTKTVLLEFNPVRDDLGKGKELRDGLSVALQIGDTLWVANDESVSLERLTLSRECKHGRQHKQFPLADYVRLPVAPPKDPADLEEVDVEGLDCGSGYLWLVGSHSLKRKDPASANGARKVRKQLAKVRASGNRFLLARIPIVKRSGTYTLAKEAVERGRKRTAAQLRGGAKGNELTGALRADKHLGPFLATPGKDNGFDIEGLAVAGKRVFLGLRGPVLHGWAVILEVEPAQDPSRSSILGLNPIGPKKRRYRKHLLELGGLGIRELCAQGRDLLILAGPTMELDGPVTLFRWRGGAKPKGASVVPAEELKRVLEVPYGKGVDHAEGLTLFSRNGGAARSILVVYDSASRSRQRGKSAVAADVFRLPRR